jgi:hypothetical protein
MLVQLFDENKILRGIQNRRYESRKQVANAVNLLSLTQSRCTMLDQTNKGGRSIVLRCSSQVRYGSGCPFYCKIRRSRRDSKWYICAKFNPQHQCLPDGIPPKYNNTKAMLDEYYVDIAGCTPDATKMKPPVTLFVEQSNLEPL